MSAADLRRLSVNRPALLSAGTAALSIVLMPPASSVLIEWFPASAFAFVSMTGAVSSVVGLRNRRRLRRAKRRAGRSSRKLGDAKPASLADLCSRGMLSETSGPLIGLTKEGVPHFGPPGTHTAVVMPTGVGKTSGIVMTQIVLAVANGESAFVLDLKDGELAAVLTPVLKSMGARVIHNDPSGISGFEHRDYNPFRCVITVVACPKRQGEAFLLADGFALQLLPILKDDGKNAFFKNNTRTLISVLLIALAVLEPEDAIPAMLWVYSTDSNACLSLLKDAAESDALHGDLAVQARGLLALQENEPSHFQSALTEAAQTLSAFRPSTPLGLTGVSDDYSPADLRDEDGPPTVIFDICPQDKLPTYGKAMALQTFARLAELKRTPGRAVHGIIDEASNMKLSALAGDITLLRSLKIRLHTYWQSIPDMKRTYGDTISASIRANSVEIYGGVADYETAKELSARIGQHTVSLEGQSFSNIDGTSNTSFSEQSTALFPPEDILALPKDTVITLVSGMRPCFGRLVPWYQIEPIKSLAGDNPNEKHPPSPITRLRFDFRVPGKPILVGYKKAIESAFRMDRRSKASRPVPLIDLRSLLWMPTVAAVWAFISFIGTPHILFEYETAQPSYESVTCTYIGIDGMRSSTALGSCSWVAFFKGEV